MNLFRAILIAILVSSPVAEADVYRCSGDDGRTIYQATPCPEGTDTGISTAPEDVAPYTEVQTPLAEPRHDEHGRIVRSQEAKDDFKRAHPCPATGARSGPCPGYVIDHIDPLACGGADAPGNMQWQTEAEGKAKDGWERDRCQADGNHRSGKKLAIEGGAGDSGATSAYHGYADGTVYTGPRGGRYHFSASGNKVYEKRK